jgi:hypothetical protein
MVRLFAFALVSTLGLLATGSIAVSLTSANHQAVSVNRALKGDRMAVTVVSRDATGAREVVTDRPVPRPNIKRDAPVGCDPLFSPITTPALAHLFRRCLT